MRLLNTLTLALSFASLNAQTVTYDIPIGQTIGLQQTSGDICSAPWTTEEAFQASAGNSWGCTWTSSNTGIATSMEIELGFTVTDGGGTFSTTLNGVASGTVGDGAFKNCENSTLMTWVIDPSNYAAGVSNNFMVDFAGATNVSQLDNLPYLGDPYMRLTVVYSECGSVDTSVTTNQNTITAGAAGATFQWIDCGTMMDINGETGSSYTATASGSYAVIITDTASSCVDTSACTQITIGGSGITQLDRVQLKAYPNPVNNLLHLALTDMDGLTTVSVFDFQGRPVLSKQIRIQGTAPISLDVSQLANGQYYVEAISPTKKAIAPFVKN